MPDEIKEEHIIRSDLNIVNIDKFPEQFKKFLLDNKIQYVFAIPCFFENGKLKVGNLTSQTSGEVMVIGVDYNGNPHRIITDSIGRLVISGKRVTGGSQVINLNEEGAILVSAWDIETGEYLTLQSRFGGKLYTYPEPNTFEKYIKIEETATGTESEEVSLHGIFHRFMILPYDCEIYIRFLSSNVGWLDQILIPQGVVTWIDMRAESFKYQSACEGIDTEFQLVAFRYFGSLD